MKPIRVELPTGLGVGPVNAYLFTEPEVVLVDAGVKSEDCWQALGEALAEHGLVPSDVSRVVITHPHVDHFGLACRLTQESDATVWICELGAPWLDAEANMWEGRQAFYRNHFLNHLGLDPLAIKAIGGGLDSLRALADPVPTERVVTFRPDGLLQLGGHSWQVLHTPGHATSQTCFYQADTEQLISADMLLAIAPTPVVEQPLDGSTYRTPSLPDFLRSLDLLESLEISEVYPGHGRPFGDHRQVIKRQRARIAERTAECLDLVRAGYETIPGLVEAMYAHHPPGSRLVGLWMLVGYLDLLIAEGAVVEQTVDGVWHYTPAP